MLKPKTIILILASCMFAVSTAITLGTAQDEQHETKAPAETTTTLSTAQETKTVDVTTTTAQSVTERSDSVTECATTTTKSVTETTLTTTTKTEPITTAITTENKPITTTTTQKTERVTTTQNTTQIAVSASGLAIGSYVPTEQEMMMFCTVVSSETGYCEDKVQKAVAHTVINRVLSSKFPNTIYEVVTQRNQYTCISNYFNGTYRKGLYPGSKAWEHTMQLCIEAMQECDFTNGAVAYYNPYMIGYTAYFEQFELVYEDKYGRFFKI